MQWDGYSSYEDFVRRLALTNPSRVPIEANKTQQFNVASASDPYMNNPLHAASTFVRRIRYLPVSKQALVTLGNSNYVYTMSRPELAHWMTSYSLGQYYNNFIKLK